MRVAGTIRPPGDKSITHRALIVAGLSRGPVELQHALSAGDVRRTAGVLRQVGVAVSPVRRDAAVKVVGAKWRTPEASLHCGNSGTTARLMLGALAGADVTARLTGDGSLRRRPMRRVTTPLIAMGARIVEQRGDGLPLCITGGRLRGVTFESPVASAQLKSAVLLAALSGRVPVTVIEPMRSRDHTERMFRHLGLDVHVDGTAIRFDGARVGDGLARGFTLEVPGDASSAAFLVAAALLADGGELLLEGVGTNPTRAGFLNVLRRMGAWVEHLEPRDVCGEPVADLLIRPSRVRGTEVTAGEIPSLIDEIPVLAALASRADGETVFRSVGELRVKESDRLSLIAENLRAIGADATVQGEDLVVSGSEAPLAGRVETARDHRLTMAFAVLGTAPGVRVELSERTSAEISYPGFFNDLERIGSHD